MFTWRSRCGLFFLSSRGPIGYSDSELTTLGWSPLGVRFVTLDTPLALEYMYRLTAHHRPKAIRR
eukprot:5804472-Prymnesium_polylepis.1